MSGFKLTKRRLVILLGCALIAAAVAGYVLGSRHYGAAMTQYRANLEAREQLAAQLLAKEQEVVNLDLADKVNRLTMEQLRQKVTELQTDLVKLESELFLYKNLVEDDEAELGLNLESLTLRATEEENRYEYRIVVRRKAALSQSIDASVTLSIEGELLGIPYSVPLNEADLSIEEDALNIRFKYFKVLRGTLALPEHFVPSKVILSLYETGRADSLVIKELPWRVSAF